jgi:uncharacterized protein (TIGR03067 family)
MFTTLLALTLAAPGPKDAPPKAEALHGLWALQSVTVDGKEHPEVDDRRWEFLPDGTQMRYVGDEKIWKVGIPYTVDPRAKPAALNMGYFASILAIYKIDGDTLTICVAQNDRKTRPSSFDPPMDANTCLYFFKRVKAND